MFGDIVKFGIRSGAVIIVIGAIVGAFAAIHLPNPDYTVFSQALGRGYAFMSHWFPNFPAIWNFTILLLGTWLSLKALAFTVYASSIVLKIIK